MEYEPADDCEFWKEGFCRVTGSACPHYKVTYEDCRTRSRALTDPERTIYVLDDKDKEESMRFRTIVRIALED